ncbi:hypothetical protein B0H11DRAFT_1362799 [Mycena galericulata]|nr:hypothetical protein B0H11DRAFT_1362799 [Mycena galericulata]
MGQRLVGFMQQTLDDHFKPHRRRTQMFYRPGYALTTPPEIISHIFCCCIALDGEGDTIVGPLCTPLVLSSVCGYWRAVALSTRPLWTSLQFRPTATSVSLLQIWLPRSGNLSLSIHMTYESTLDPSTACRIISTLRAHASRWERIRLFFPRLQSTALSGPFPRLRELAIVCPTLIEDSWQQTSGTLYYFGDVGDGPRLDVVRLVNLSPYDRLVLPWNRITMLHLDLCAFFISPMIARQRSLAIFHLCPNLVHCVLKNCRGFFQLRAPPHAPHVHNRLEYLSIEGLAFPILRFFVFPQLNFFSISTSPSEYIHLPAFLGQSPRLKCFLIKDGTAPISLPVLISAVSITELGVDCSLFSPTLCCVFFRILRTMPTVLPHLRRLKLIDGVPEHAFSYSGLVALLGGLGRLDLCHVTFRDMRAAQPPHPYVFYHLNELLRQGMDLHISSPAISWPRRNAEIPAASDMLP